MTSSNGNIFRVTGPLCGEFTGPGEFPTQRPVTRSFEVFFDLRLNKRLSKQPWGWWFETLSWSLWRHCNDMSKKTYSKRWDGRYHLIARMGIRYVQQIKRHLCWNGSKLSWRLVQDFLLDRITVGTLGTVTYVTVHPAWRTPKRVRNNNGH